VSISPHSGIIDFGVFTPPEGGKDGIQGEVPQPLIAEVGYILSSDGWISGGSIAGLGTMAQEDSDSVNITGGDISGTRIDPRVNDLNTTASPFNWNGDNYDIEALDALQNNLTISADAGTPVDAQKMIFRISDNGVSRTITFTGGVSKGFRTVGVTLTVSGSNYTYSTVAGKFVYFGCIYNSHVSRWDIIALSQEL
jgi:hypothetical protein